MDPGLVGGLIGAFMGLIGGAIGTYVSIRNTAGPRERAFMIRVARVWIAVTAFVVALLVVPYPHKWFLWVACVPALVTAIVWGNRRQRQIRSEEGAAATFADPDREATMSVRVSLGRMLAAGALVAAAVWLGSRVPAAQTARPAASDRATFVGTYRLAFTEVKDDKGQWTRTPNFNSVGYITYADTGHMGVHIMPRNRPRFASNQNQPTPEEAQAAVRGYTAYFGPFTVDEGKKIVTHHRVGTIRPGQPAPFLRYYEFTADRLILTPVPANNGSREQATNRLVWERLPNAPLSAEEKKFLGFHKLLYTDSYRMKDGKEIFHGDRVETRANTSWIIYTPTGHMMVHLMDNKGRTEYAGAQATPAEALAAYRTYSGYFGRFTTYENYNPPFVLHNQQGTLRPGGENDATKRFYQFTGNVLRLGTPPNVNAAGETAGGHLYWEKLPPTK